jgi:hypothetical protein
MVEVYSMDDLSMDQLRERLERLSVPN